VQFSRHIRITGDALRRWFVAQCCDAAAVGAMWWAGLMFLHVPWAPFWGIVAAIAQFIPHFGPVLALMGPAIVALFANGFMSFVYILILYGGIVLIDGLLLQPMIMKRTVRVPIWASLLVPLVLSFALGFWGLLLAAPLLAVIFAYREIQKSRESSISRQTPPGREITGGRLISPEEAMAEIPRQKR